MTTVFQMDKLFLVGISTVFSILLIILPLTYADNNTNTTSLNFSAAQEAGNKVFNHMMCNKDPSYCPGGMNAP